MTENGTQTRTVHVRFDLDTPVIMNNLLHLDALLAARIATACDEPPSFRELRRMVPVERERKSGVFLCSAAFFSGKAPEKRRVCFQQNIWNVAEFDRYAQSMKNPYFQKDRKDKGYPTNLDEYWSMNLPYLDFLARVPMDGFSLFERLIHEVDGLGKKTSHGFGQVSNVSFTDYDGHPWVTPGDVRMVSRAVPIRAWMEVNGVEDVDTVKFMKDYASVSFPYHLDGEPCVVPDGERPLRYRFFASNHYQEEVAYA